MRSKMDEERFPMRMGQDERAWYEKEVGKSSKEWLMTYMPWLCTGMHALRLGRIFEGRV